MKKNKKIKNKKTNKKIIILKLVLALLLFLLVGVIAYFIYGTVKNGGGTSGFVATAMGQSKEDIENLEPFSALILGSSQNLTDTIMVFKYNPKTQKAYLVSIPRDTFVGNNKEKAKAADKINSLYQGKDPQRTLNAVKKITGLPLEYYVVIDTEALKALVDAIGGVYFDVPIDMDYTDENQDLYIDLKQGYQLLDGNKAEQVVRFRHNQDGSSYPAEYGDNDIGRMKTQRNFLKAVMKQTLTPSNIVNIGKFIDIAQKYVKTNIPIDVLKKYIAPAVSFNTDNLETGTLPGTPEKCNGVWLYIANKSKTKTYFAQMSRLLANINEFSEDELSNVKIEILNGSGKKINLTNVKKVLSDAGFTVSKTGNTNSTAKTSIVNKTNVSEDIVSSIKHLLNVSAEPESDFSEESIIDIKIIIGKDYN